VPEAVEESYEEIEESGPSSIRDLQRKMRLEGTVSRVELFGAFVDVGVGTDGLVHISQLSAERVNRVSEVVSEGDRVTVWVLGVEPAKKRIDLTMIEPAAVDWDEIRAGQVYTGRVKRVERYGAFVDIGVTRDGLVHVSEITSDYIQDPKEYVKVGDEVQVKVLKVDNKRRRIELSMKELEEHLSADEDEDTLEEAPTAMELAWRDAQSTDEIDRSEERRKKTRQQLKEDDIYARTLRLRSDQE
jgi:small subunit ribosomal protein S1